MLYFVKFIRDKPLLLDGGVECNKTIQNESKKGEKLFMKTLELKTNLKDILKTVLKETADEELIILEQPKFTLEDIKKIIPLKKASCRVTSMVSLDFTGFVAMMVLGDKERSLFGGCTVSFEGASKISNKEKRLIFGIIEKRTSDYKLQSFMSHCRNESILELRQLRKFGLINGSFFNQSENSVAKEKQASSPAAAESQEQSQITDAEPLKKASAKVKESLSESEKDRSKAVVKKTGKYATKNPALKVKKVISKK